MLYRRASCTFHFSPVPFSPRQGLQVPPCVFMPVYFMPACLSPFCAEKGTVGPLKEQTKAAVSIGQALLESYRVQVRSRRATLRVCAISSNDFRPGVCIEIDGAPWKVVGVLPNIHQLQLCYMQRMPACPQIQVP